MVADGYCRYPRMFLLGRIAIDAVKHAKNCISLRVEGLRNALTPNLHLLRREAGCVERGHEFFDVDARSVLLVAESMATASVQEADEFIFVNVPDDGVSGGKIVPNVPALIEHEVAGFGNEIQLEAKSQQFRILHIEQLLLVEVFVDDLRDDMDSEASNLFTEFDDRCVPSVIYGGIE